jgi:hypothetical protein
MPGCKHVIRYPPPNGAVSIRVYLMSSRFMVFGFSEPGKLEVWFAP